VVAGLGVVHRHCCDLQLGGDSVGPLMCLAGSGLDDRGQCLGDTGADVAGDRAPMREGSGDGLGDGGDCSSGRSGAVPRGLGGSGQEGTPLMKGRRVSGNLLFVGFPAPCLSVLLEGYELIALCRLRIDRAVARATITPAHHRISQNAATKLQRSVEVSSKPGSLPAPRTVVPRPAIEESEPGHRGSDSPLNDPDRPAAAAHEDKAMSPTVVLQTTINVRLGTSNIFLEFTWLGGSSEAHSSSAGAGSRASDPGVTHLP